ncbi:hypothetical protein [Pseudolysinimonas yzui]|uniref:Uncharacterized protein n=1 Tax=Pseudolysinimonas yzui TaxID=2708254 RepID=A0A8J3GMQ7_9MICO|nr:hypothetical protein [Pseudolysinimonas yzui]GHF04392.1 hypothetical protein GCM10011600_00950 [Pseudolysinimonas yzui]
MSDNPTPPEVEVQSIIESARRLGVELDEAETVQWLTAIAAETETDLEVDEASGTFGHRVAMLDFTPRDLARFRAIGKVVELTGDPDVTEGALALSGSAAQSKIQSYPGDADFFQRFNIKAPTRDEACAILARSLKEKVLAFTRGTTYQFLEAKLGSTKAGAPISWTLADIEAGVIQTVDGEVRWEDAARDPGWVKADWVVTDPARHRLSNASNVIDVTWEAPNGDIVPLDGYLDTYFQEVYLDAESVPTFAKVVQHVSDDALDEYVEQLEGEVRKYLTKHLNYGKAAKRMYNVFRLSGRHLDAAFVRELFDEPTTILYQVWSLIVTLDNATQPGSGIPISDVRAQADALVLEVVRALEGAEETEIVEALQQLSRTLEFQPPGEARSAEVDGAQARVVNLVNTFFRDKLTAMPTIREYIEAMQAEPAAH